MHVEITTARNPLDGPRNSLHFILFNSIDSSASNGYPITQMCLVSSRLPRISGGFRGGELIYRNTCKMYSIQKSVRNQVRTSFCYNRNTLLLVAHLNYSALIELLNSLLPYINIKPIWGNTQEERFNILGNMCKPHYYVRRMFIKQIHTVIHYFCCKRNKLFLF